MSPSRFFQFIATAVVFSVLMVTQTFAAQGEFEDRLVGRWESNKEKSKEYAAKHEHEKLPDHVMEQLPEFSFEFLENGDAKAEMKISVDLGGGAMPDKSMEGDWKILEETDEDHAKLRIMFQVGDREDAKEVTVEFVDDDTIILKVIDEPSTLVFTRSVKEKENQGEVDDEAEALDKNDQKRKKRERAAEKVKENDKGDK